VAVKNILYLNHVSEMGGGSFSLFQLITHLDRGQYKPILLTQMPGSLSKMAAAEGIETYFLQMPGWRKVRYAFRKQLVTLPSLKRLVKKLKIDLIHCNAYRLNSYGVLISKCIHVPCITHVRWFNRKDHIRKFNLSKTDLLITVSDYIASFFSGSRAKVRTIYNGIEISKFLKNKDSRKKIRNEFKIAENAILIGMVAALTPTKGHKDFIKAAALVKKILPNAEFLAVGGPILEKQLSINDLKQYARQVGADNVLFAGNREDVADIYSALDYFVLPSHIEPFGRVIIEAMASKVPVIATKCGGPEEIITDRKNGLLIPVKSPDAIAEKIVELAENPGLARGLVDSAFKTVNEKFDISCYVNNVERVYRDFLG